MTDNEIIKALESLHKRILHSRFARDVTEDEIMAVVNAIYIINRQKAEIERLNRMYLTVCESLDKAEKQISTAQAEAIKEFAERLNEYVSITVLGIPVVALADINNLVKEMVGEDK